MGNFLYVQSFVHGFFLSQCVLLTACTFMHMQLLHLWKACESYSQAVYPSLGGTCFSRRPLPLSLLFLQAKMV